MKDVKRIAVILVVLLSACESNEAKYARLNQELLVAQGMVQWGPVCDTLPPDTLVSFPDGPARGPKASCKREVEDSRTKLALLQREMNQFMNGR